MVDNQHRLIPGYRDLDKDEIDTITMIKMQEEQTANLWKWVSETNEVVTDPRELALAKTHFEDAFMHFVKAIAKPDSPWNEEVKDFDSHPNSLWNNVGRGRPE